MRSHTGLGVFSKAPGWVRFKSLLLFALAMTVSAALLGSVGVKSAFACGPYWTVGCQNYNYQEGHSILNQGADGYEWVYTTFSPTSLTVKAIWTTNGGSWIQSEEVGWGVAVEFYPEFSTDKNGCYNDHTQTMWINCRAADTYQ